MGIVRFIFSKSFLIQLVLAVVLVVAVVFLSMYWLKGSTNHDQRIAVPDLGKMNLVLVKQKLDESDLNYVVIDSSNYNPDFPKYSVIEQTPAPGKFVKENRKIYLVMNPSGYRQIEVPDVVGRTLRQAEPTLIAIGFKVGSITYKPYIAEDEVLEMRHEGKKLESGTRLRKTSTIDLILGDGTE
jgi:beta-lactam-binding protein with PASTA domain